MRISQGFPLWFPLKLEFLEMWVRLAGSNVFFTWNYLFCQVAVEGGDAWNEQKNTSGCRKKFFMRLGREAKKESF